MGAKRFVSGNSLISTSFAAYRSSDDLDCQAPSTTRFDMTFLDAALGLAIDFCFYNETF